MTETIEQLLEKTGLGFISVKDIEKNKITLRDGREATLWIDRISGHGILDPKFWQSAEYYSKEYRQEFSHKLNDFSKPESHLQVYRKLNERQFSLIKCLITTHSRYLEIGCSFGGILRQVVEHGVAEAWGIEPNREDATFINQMLPRVNILAQPIEDAILPSRYFDVAASFEVLEHVANPSAFLKKAKSSLTQNGTLIIEVPNHKDALLYVYRNEAYQKFYYHKAHIHYFTAESLISLMRQEGFAGEVSGFQMYPMFNQIHWHLHNQPQESAHEALNWKRLSETDNRYAEIINSFFSSTFNEYNVVVEKNMISDCLVFRGKIA